MSPCARVEWPAGWFVTPVLHPSATNFVSSPDFLCGANALVTQGQEIPDYSVVLGSPGKVVRTVDPSEAKLLEQGVSTITIERCTDKGKPSLSLRLDALKKADGA